MEYISVQTSMVAFYYFQYLKGEINHIISCLVPRKILLRQYEVMINLKEISPIETLPEAEKEKLRSECQATGLKFNNREMNNAARILYTLKNISKP